MAEADPSPRDTDPYLKATFSIQKFTYDVLLSETTLSWIKRGNDASKTEYVPIEEILYADKSLGVDGAVCGFDLGYMEHRKNNVRRHKVVHFVGSADEAENWSKKIQEATIKVPDRPRRLLVLINPVSGSSKGRQIYKTYAAGIFRMAHVETDAIVLVGGDGLYHEAVNGLQLRMVKEAGLDKNDSSTGLQPLPLPIGIIPAGTGNGIAATHNGTKDIQSAVLTIIVGKKESSHIVGVFCCGELVAYSSLLVGYGMWGDMSYIAESRQHLGKLRHLVGFIEGLFIRSLRQTEIVVDYLPSTKSSDEGENTQTDDLENNDKITSSGETSDARTQWQRFEGVFSGEFLDVSDMMKLFVNKESHREDGMTLVVNKPFTRLQLLGFIKKMFNLDKSLLDDEKVVHLAVKEYRLKVVYPHSEETEMGRMERSLSIDGEYFRLKQPEMLVRLHPNTVQLYSRGPLYRYRDKQT